MEFNYRRRSLSILHISVVDWNLKQRCIPSFKVLVAPLPWKLSDGQSYYRSLLSISIILIIITSNSQKHYNRDSSRYLIVLVFHVKIERGPNTRMRICLLIVYQKNVFICCMQHWNVEASLSWSFRSGLVPIRLSLKKNSIWGNYTVNP